MLPCHIYNTHIHTLLKLEEKPHEYSFSIELHTKIFKKTRPFRQKYRQHEELFMSTMFSGVLIFMKYTHSSAYDNYILGIGRKNLHSKISYHVYLLIY